MGPQAYSRVECRSPPFVWAFAGCSGGESDATAELGETEAGVGLELVQQLSSVEIK